MSRNTSPSKPKLLSGYLHVKAIDTDGTVSNLQAFSKPRRRFVQVVEGRALRIFKDAESARAAERAARRGDSANVNNPAQNGLATLLLYKTIFLRPGGEKFAGEFGKFAQFVMQIISPQCTWLVAAETEPSFKKWLRVVATSIDRSAVCPKFAWAASQKASSPKMTLMKQTLKALSNVYGATDEEQKQDDDASRTSVAAADQAQVTSPRVVSTEETFTDVPNAGSNVPESAGLLGTMCVRRATAAVRH